MAAEVIVQSSQAGLGSRLAWFVRGEGVFEDQLNLRRGAASVSSPVPASELGIFSAPVTVTRPPEHFTWTTLIHCDPISMPNPVAMPRLSAAKFEISPALYPPLNVLANKGHWERGRPTGSAGVPPAPAPRSQNAP